MDHGANLPELDHQLRRIRRNDQHIRMRLYQDPRVLLVGLAHLLAGGYGLVHTSVEISRLHDASAVATVAAEAREVTSVIRMLARLQLTFPRHREHKCQGVLATAASARNHQ